MVPARALRTSYSPGPPPPYAARTPQEEENVPDIITSHLTNWQTNGTRYVCAEGFFVIPRVSAEETLCAFLHGACAVPLADACRWPRPRWCT